MFNITADAALKQQLVNLDKAAAIRDSEGRLLGRVVSEESFHDLIYSWLQAEIAQAELPKYEENERRKVLDGIMAKASLFIHPIPEPLKTRLAYLWGRNIVTDQELADETDDGDSDMTLAQIFAELERIHGVPNQMA